MTPAITDFVPRARAARGEARRTIAMAVAVAILAPSIAACSGQDGNVYLHFQNNTPGSIEVVLINPTTGSEYVMQPEVKAGETSITRSDVYPGDMCSDSRILVARDGQGHEIARRTGRICKGDTWEIDDRSSPPT